MSEKKIGFFGETPVPEGELVHAMGRDLFDKVRALGEDRDAWVERARQAEAGRDEAREALEKYGRHHGHCGAAAYPCPSSCTCGLAEALKGAE